MAAKGHSHQTLHRILLFAFNANYLEKMNMELR